MGKPLSARRVIGRVERGGHDGQDSGKPTTTGRPSGLTEVRCEKDHIVAERKGTEVWIKCHRCKRYTVIPT